MTGDQQLAGIMARSGFEALLAVDSAVLDAIPAAIYVCAADGTILRFNSRAAALWGRTPRPGSTDEKFCGAYRLHDTAGRPLPHASTPMAEVLNSGAAQRDLEVVIERPDGSRIVAQVNIEPLKDDHGRMQGAVNCFQDVTGRKRTEETLAMRVAEQAALFRLTDSLHRARSLSEAYEAALEAIVVALRCQRASVLLFDSTGRMSFVAWRGLSDGYRAAAEGHSPWTADTENPEVLCIDDIATADIDGPLKARIREEGIGALAFIPLVADGRLVGKFMSYYDAPHVFTDSEVDLAVAIARQLVFGIERVRAEEARRDAEKSLRESEARQRAHAAELATIMGAVPAVIWIARDPECRMIDGNAFSYEFLRLPSRMNQSLSAEEGERPANFKVLIDGQLASTEELPVQRAARGEVVRDFEEEVRFEDGRSRFLFGNATPLRDAEGRPIGAVAAFVDITDRKKAEEQRDLLVAELSHRVKNTLATVISIAAQSFSDDTDIAEARESFASRIRALAQTHNHLAEANWSGASFTAMLLDEFAPYHRDDGSNVSISGPSITLSPKCALTVGLTIHEMATNAAKHGALSTASGSVDVAWDVDDGRRLEIRWVERGGPAVDPPERSGFGRLLIERAAAFDLGGDVQLDFARDGLRCTIAIPFEDHVARFG